VFRRFDAFRLSDALPILRRRFISGWLLASTLSLDDLVYRFVYHGRLDNSTDQDLEALCVLEFRPRSRLFDHYDR